MLKGHLCFGAEIRVFINLVDCIKHGLQSVDPLLLLQLPTRHSSLSLCMDWEEPPQNDVPIHSYGMGILLAVSSLHHREDPVELGGQEEETRARG